MGEPMPQNKKLKCRVRKFDYHDGFVRTGETKTYTLIELQLKAPTEQVIKECLMKLKPSMNQIWIREWGVSEPMELILANPDKYLGHLYRVPTTPENIPEVFHY